MDDGIEKHSASMDDGIEKHSASMDDDLKEHLAMVMTSAHPRRCEDAATRTVGLGYAAKRRGEASEALAIRPHPGPGQDKDPPRASVRSSRPGAFHGPSPSGTWHLRGVEPQDTRNHTRGLPALVHYLHG